MQHGLTSAPRFAEPADEMDYSGVCAEKVEIDEIELDANVYMQVEIEADFTFDGIHWVADCVWLKTYRRDTDGFKYNFIDKWTIASAENGLSGIVEAAEKWADKHLCPEDYQ
jgi:hypothetical protein